MARAALSVVFSHGRDEEVTALRARIAEMQRQQEGLIWMDRLNQVIVDRNRWAFYGSVTDKVYEILVYPIEQERWGVRPGVRAGGIRHQPGLFLFNRYEPQALRVELTIIEELVRMVHAEERLTLSALMRRVEARLGLPSDSLARLPEGARYRG